MNTFWTICCSFEGRSILTVYQHRCTLSHFGDSLMFYVLNSHLLALQICWNEGSVLKQCFVFSTWQANWMHLRKKKKKNLLYLYYLHKKISLTHKHRHTHMHNIMQIALFVSVKNDKNSFLQLVCFKNHASFLQPTEFFVCQLQGRELLWLRRGSECMFLCDYPSSEEVVFSREREWEW